jgi:hypothetical protein
LYFLAFLNYTILRVISLCKAYYLSLSLLSF